MKTTATPPDYKGFRFPSEMISHAVFPLLPPFSVWSRNGWHNAGSSPLIDVLCQGLCDLADDTERLRSLTGYSHLNVPLEVVNRSSEEV
jgi:hypothetical protein